MILKVDFGMDRTDEDDEDEGGPRHYAPENDMHTGYYTVQESRTLIFTYKSWGENGSWRSIPKS